MQNTPFVCIFQFFLTTKRNHISVVSEWRKWKEKKKYLCAFDWSCSSPASTSKCATWWWLQTECGAAMEYRSTLLKAFIYELVLVARFIFCRILPVDSCAWRSVSGNVKGKNIFLRFFWRKYYIVIMVDLSLSKYKSKA